MRHGVVLLLVLVQVCTGQGLIEARERVITGLGILDDIEFVPTASPPFLASLPTQSRVGFVDPSLNLTQVATGTVHGMALEPGGQALWVGDFGPGTLRRIDLATGQVTATLSGFDHPLEIYFTGPQTFIVGSILTVDFFNSPGYLKEVTLGAGGSPPTVQTLTNNVVGGMDVAVNAEGRLFMVSLGSNNLDEVDVTTGAVTAVAGPVFGGTDLLEGPGNTVYVTTLFAAEVLQVDPHPTSPTITQLAALLAEAPGPGAEDMALDGNGDLLVAMNNGDLWRVPLQREIQQHGAAFPPLSFDIALDFPQHPGALYLLAASTGLGPPLPIPGTGESVLLNPDPLFTLSLMPSISVFQNWLGVLDANGRALATTPTPPLPPGAVWDIYVQGVIADQGTTTLQDVTDVLKISLFN